MIKIKELGNFDKAIERARFDLVKKFNKSQQEFYDSWVESYDMYYRFDK